MSEVHEVLNASLAINQQLSAEIDALRKHASSLKKEASLHKSASRSFSNKALADATNVLVDCGFVKSASKDAFITMCKQNPDKALEALQKVASQMVKPSEKSSAVGSVVQKNAGWFSVSSASKADPYKDCFARY